MADIELLKKLRRETGVSFAECKKALEEAGGNLDAAKEILKKRGQKIAAIKSMRETGEGLIATYLHPNKRVGVILDLKCESDFVAKSPEFTELAHELALQIAAMNPLYVKPEEIPAEFLDGERKIYEDQLKDAGKTRKIINDIVEGKLDKYKKEVSLLSQAWIKDENKTIQELINERIAKTGENITVKRFARYEV